MQSTWFEKGRSLSEAGHYADAVEAYTRAIEQDPGNALLYNNRGLIHWKMGRTDLAKKDLTKLEK